MNRLTDKKRIEVERSWFFLFLACFTLIPFFNFAEYELRYPIIHHLDVDECEIGMMQDEDPSNLKFDEQNEEDLRIADYLAFIFQFEEYLGSSGNHKKGEIEVILEPKKIVEIQELQRQCLLKRGVSDVDASNWSRVGVIITDSFWMWIRDAVIFPSGVYGTYNRIIWKSSLDGPTGVAILPILQDGKIICLLNYRHATRTWEVELPRGCRVYGESPEKAAIRELREEAGLIMGQPIFLGTMTRDTGSLNSVTPVYLGHVIEQIDSYQEYSEAILGLLVFTKDELKKAFKKGFVEIKYKGNILKIPLRDGSLAFALMQAEMRNLI